MSRLDSLLDALQDFYGQLPRPPRDPFTLFVWEVLSAHATPRKRDAALAALKRIPALTPDSMGKAPRKKLEDCVVLAGPYAEQRLRALKNGVDMFRRAPKLPALIKGPLPGARRALKGLPQMGEGGLHRMLLFAAQHQVLPVDAPLSRTALRLGYGQRTGSFAKAARSIREAVAGELTSSVDAYRRAFLYLSHHGSATCTESEPHCTVCPLLTDCPQGQKRLQIAAC